MGLEGQSRSRISLWVPTRALAQNLATTETATLVEECPLLPHHLGLEDSYDWYTAGKPGENKVRQVTGPFQIVSNIPRQPGKHDRPLEASRLRPLQQPQSDKPKGTPIHSPTLLWST